MNSGIITVPTASGTAEYVERPQDFGMRIQVTAAGQILRGLQLAIPGQYAFRLKMAMRDILVPNSGYLQRGTRPFLFRLGNSTDGSWYVGGAIQTSTSGIVTDSVLDTNFFGTGQLPRVFTPDILYAPGSLITMEITDLSGVVPYEIDLNFSGAYLVPVDGSNSIVSAGV